MDRLTYKDNYGNAHTSMDPDQVISKLSYYEDLEEQDRMLILPVSPGIELYLIDLNCSKIKKPKDCDNECANCKYRKCEIYPYTPETKHRVALMTRTLGYDCFLTKEDAEKRIKELNKEREED